MRERSAKTFHFLFQIKYEKITPFMSSAFLKLIETVYKIEETKTYRGKLYFKIPVT